MRKRTDTKFTATQAVAELRKLATQKTLVGMARFAIPTENALGVTVGDMRKLAKRIGTSHELAAQLWKTGIYEARMLASFIDDPELVTAAQMESWCKDFDSWGICDTVCFCLFDRTPLAWKKIQPWIKRKAEFEKRAGFVMMACLAGHDKAATDDQFFELLPLIENNADDGRNFVKKGVSWGLRMIGRRSPALYNEALKVAERLADSDDAAERWVGKDAVRDLNSAPARKKVARIKARTAG